METLRQARKNKGYSLRNLRELSGITVPHLSWLENGKVLPSLVTRARLEEILEERINWLDVSFQITAREPSADWDDCERDFRYLLKSVKSLPETERNEFIKSAKRHLNSLLIKSKKS